MGRLPESQGRTPARISDPASGVVVICGMKREASILAGGDRITVCGDASTLQRALAARTGSRPRLVISWGLCGGLDPRLRPGDLVVGTEVSSDQENIRADEAVVSLLVRRLAEAGASAGVGGFAAVLAPVLTASDKTRLLGATGAVTVDMESMIAARFARDCGAPFAILRAVADPAERALPPFVAKALDPEGRVRPGAVVAGLLRSPGQLASLGRVARDSRAAFSALERCGRCLPGLFLGLGLADL